MANYIKITAKIKNRLKQPLGKVCQNLEEIKKISRTNRIVSVGDLSTLMLLGFGIRPHLAVFDFRYSRKKLEPTRIGILKHVFRHMHTYTNKKGTLSKELLKDAKELLHKGGAVKINGEEDLTALAFMKYADAKTLVVYGQPGEGIVVVTPDKKSRKKIKEIMGEIEK